MSIFLYYKSRSPEDLSFMLNFLEKLNIHVRVFSYTSKYNEEDYINYLHNSKFGIWLDAHESQGFALEEALSCNVPLFVWNITSLNQEYGSNYPNLPATSIPYWDNRCGESFTTISEIQDKFQIFMDNLTSYKPREYVLENLSMGVCENKLINIIENI
jgi:glycosyltransferase involved in cell wall biosynthesis